jgi:hypothetical protein
LQSPRAYGCFDDQPIEEIKDRDGNDIRKPGRLSAPGFLGIL